MKKLQVPRPTPPLHRGRDQRENALQYNNGACPPLFRPSSKGELEGVLIINLKSKIKTMVYANFLLMKEEISLVAVIVILLILRHIRHPEKL